jgi:hypothetical protein
LSAFSSFLFTHNVRQPFVFVLGITFGVGT